MSVRARFVAVALTALVSSLLPSAASAATFTKNDADDSAGLDLSSVVLQSRPTKLIVTLRTYEAFSNAALKPKNGALGIAFKIDRKTVRAIGIGTNRDGNLKARICSAPTGGSNVNACSALSVSRVDDFAVKVTIPKFKLKRGIKTYVWSAIAYDTCGGDQPCVDSAPDRRFARWTP